MNLFTYMYNYNKRQQFCITSTWSTAVQKAASKIATMFYPRVALITLTLLRAVTFIHCYRCDVSHPKENCLTLWTAFQNSILSQHNNLLRIDLMFNQPSRLTPTVVKVIYNYSITGLDDCDSTCTNNCSVVLGWTAQALYRYFHVSVINQLRFQLPFLIINSLEDSHLGEEPDVDDYLWVGDKQTSLPELYLTLDVTFTPENNTLNGCPSNENIINALGELNHWVSSMHTMYFAVVLYSIKSSIRMSAIVNGNTPIPYTELEFHRIHTLCVLSTVSTYCTYTCSNIVSLH